MVAGKFGLQGACVEAARATEPHSDCSAEPAQPGACRTSRGSFSRKHGHDEMDDSRQLFAPTLLEEVLPPLMDEELVRLDAEACEAEPSDTEETFEYLRSARAKRRRLDTEN